MRILREGEWSPGGLAAHESFLLTPDIGSRFPGEFLRTLDK
jgi:hypothetical protein